MFQLLLVVINLNLLAPAICLQSIDTFGKTAWANAGEVLTTCQAVVTSALIHNVDPFVVVATCEQESKCIPGLVSSAGAMGPLQVTGYWTHSPVSELSQEELAFAGVRALKLLRTCRRIDWQNLTCTKARTKPRPWTGVLCHYNGGNRCFPASLAYSRRILRDASRLRNDFRRRY